MTKLKPSVAPQCTALCSSKLQSNTSAKLLQITVERRMRGSPRLQSRSLIAIDVLRRCFKTSPILLWQTGARCSGRSAGFIAAASGGWQHSTVSPALSSPSPQERHHIKTCACFVLTHAFPLPRSELGFHTSCF